MKKMLTFMASILMLTSTSYASERPSDICPGQIISATCGNKTCDAWLGENESSCPNDCKPFKVKSYNSAHICNDVKEVITIESWDQARDIMLDRAGKNEKVRFIATRHSVSDSICNDGTVIETIKMNKIHGLETFNDEEVVLVDSGVMTWDLAEWLHERNRSYGLATVGYREATIGGTIINGSHGSSATSNAFMPSLVRWVEIIDGEGNYHQFDKATTEPAKWKSVTASLGMFGLVTRMKIAVQPQFNLDTQLTYGDESEFFDETGILDEVAHCDFVIVNWFAQTGKYMKTCGTRTFAQADSGADNKILDPYPFLPAGAGALIKPLWHQATCDADRSLQGVFESQKLLEFMLVPPLERKSWFFGLPERKSRVIGPVHRIATSKLSKDGEQTANLDFEIFVPHKHVQAALEEVNRIFERHNGSAWTVGVYLRFSQPDNNSLMSLGSTGGDFVEGETGMFVEFPVLKPAGFVEDGPWFAWYTTPYREAAEALITKFGGRPHAGKNNAELFRLANQSGVWEQNIEQYKAQLNAFPGANLFNNDFAKQIGVRPELSQ